MSALDERARDILRGNDRGGYTLPTQGLYPYQWNWDSAFAAWGFSTFDIDRAWVELETLFSGQWPGGMVPHILFHKPDPGYFPGPEVWGTQGKGPIASSGISQPPVAATMTRFVYEADRDLGGERLRALFPKLVDWHRWFMDWRSEDGAICITHPWEAGRDNAPDWDNAMAGIDPTGVGEYTRRDTAHVNPEMRPTKYDYDRYIWLVQLGRRLGWDDTAWKAENPFRVADPTMTFILLRACRDLAQLGAELGEDISEIDAWIGTLEGGAASLWNEELGAYDARDVKSGKWSDCLSCASYLCWYAGIADDRMQLPLKAMWDKVAYGVPSYDPSGPKFDAKRYWRGPVWGMMNAITALGLAEQGLVEDAERLRASTAALISEHGFAEYFDPRDGSPAGGGTFTWTAAIWLTWASPSAGRD